MYELFFILTFIVASTNAINDEILAKIHKSMEATNKSIDAISTEWSIKEYPNFLKSCFMHKSSWDIMKFKYKARILDAYMSNIPTSFVISFTGSSVTAGHDILYNESYPFITGNYMRDSFAAVDITLDSRNVALGNNPCLPYDVCVKTFAGLDADVAVWEQNYFCDGQPPMEQFIRQSMAMPTQPIVVFTEAQTGHWNKNECKQPPHEISVEEAALLHSKPIDLVSDLNKDEYHRAWGVVNKLSKYYHSAGLQTFQHMKHRDYACLGPYIPDWEKGAASWHPSTVAHKMRGAHHAYFWLLIWRDALTDLSAMLSHRAIDAVHKDLDHHIAQSHVKMGPAQFKTPFVDDMNCMTDYEPRYMADSSLRSKVIGGKLGEEGVDKAPKEWKPVIYENLVDKHLVEKSHKMGYKDFKRLLYGGKDTGPLSIALSTNKTGPVSVCIARTYCIVVEDIRDIFVRFKYDKITYYF